MNGGQACRTIESGDHASFHADLAELCRLDAMSEPPPSSGRSEALTQPYTDAYADTLASPTSLDGDHAHWCVDTGGFIATMTTFELWESLERGQVLAWMRVWREGMECWTPVGDIPEFAWAIASIPDAGADPEPPSAPDLPAEAVTGPPLPAVAPEVPPLTPEPPPQSSVRPLPRPLFSGARWIALGSGIAVAAVALAIVVRRKDPPPPPVASAGAGLAMDAVDAVTAAPPLLPADPPAAEPLGRHDERGQRRLPRGGRRAYGR